MAPTKLSATLIFVLLIALCTRLSRGEEKSELVVHEWGTFTSIQDETGRSLGYVNADGQRLPAFVKSLSETDEAKGAPVSRQVTMRLETPVAYFHLPKSASPITLDFSAEFHGGLLTQFYPHAEIGNKEDEIDTLSINTIGRATWKNVLVGTGQAGPATDDHVWTAPRNVDAADITMPNGQSERFIFYRGVAAIPSPIFVTRNGDALQVTRSDRDSLARPKGLMYERFWYLDILSDGRLAFRVIKPTPNEPAWLSSGVDARFTENEYTVANREKLRAELKNALVAEGLFEDEAQAMLNTWDAAYFKTPGARVLYVVPRAWTDFHLPIKISVPARIERVMIGRVDLLTPDLKAEVDKTVAEYHRLVAAGQGNPDVPKPNVGRFQDAIWRDAEARYAKRVK